MTRDESYWRYSIEIDARVWEFTEHTLGDCLIKIGHIINRERAGEEMPPPAGSMGYDETRVRVRRWTP